MKLNQGAYTVRADSCSLIDTNMDQNDVQEPTEFETYNAKIDIHSLPIYSRSQLSIYNGIDHPNIYVAIRGYIYDVSGNAKNYGPGKGYHKLVGKDVSRLLGLNKLQIKEPTAGLSEVPTGRNLENSTWYTDDLDDKENDRIDKWVLFFKKRYNIIGVVVDHQNRHF